MVGVLGDPQPRGEGLRDEDAHHVTADGGERRIVEDRPAPLEHPTFLQLGGPAGPAELVVPPPPDVPDDEDAQREIGQRDPPEDVRGAHARTAFPPMYSGGANGSRPTSS